MSDVYRVISEQKDITIVGLVMSTASYPNKKDITASHPAGNRDVYLVVFKQKDITDVGLVMSTASYPSKKTSPHLTPQGIVMSIAAATALPVLA